MKARAMMASGWVTAAAALLGGCANGGQALTGRVLAGKVGVVTVVSADDPRLSEPGVGGVTVSITRDRASGTIAEAVTEADGSFSLRLSDEATFSRVELVASGPGVLTCRGSLYPPRDGRQVLVLVEPSGSGGVGERAR